MLLTLGGIAVDSRTGVFSAVTFGVVCSPSDSTNEFNRTGRSCIACACAYPAQRLCFPMHLRRGGAFEPSPWTVPDSVLFRCSSPWDIPPPRPMTLSDAPRWSDTKRNVNRGSVVSLFTLAPWPWGVRGQRQGSSVFIYKPKCQFSVPPCDTR